MLDYESSFSNLDGKALYEACRSEQIAVQARAYRVLWDYLYRVVYQLVRSQPDCDDVAQDCAQNALVRIHQRISECQSPDAFRSWARRIASNLAIDELRQRKRRSALSEPNFDMTDADELTLAQESPEKTILAQLSEDELRSLLNQAPISDRSRRVVVGRFLDDIDDEILAKQESELAKEKISPSHIQVTRAKNLAKLRAWKLIYHYLKPADE